MRHLPPFGSLCKLASHRWRSDGRDLEVETDLGPALKNSLHALGLALRFQMGVDLVALEERPVVAFALVLACHDERFIDALFHVHCILNYSYLGA